MNAGIPFIVAGDWKVLPSELSESDWLAPIQGRCVREVSCNSAVCHRSLMNIVKLQSFVGGLWKTHQALLLTLPRAPWSYLTRSAPMLFPPIARNSDFSITWSECVDVSRSCNFRQPDKRLPGFLDPVPGLIQQLALEF